MVEPLQLCQTGSPTEAVELIRKSLKEFQAVSSDESSTASEKLQNAIDELLTVHTNEVTCDHLKLLLEEVPDSFYVLHGCDLFHNLFALSSEEQLYDMVIEIGHRLIKMSKPKEAYLVLMEGFEVYEEFDQLIGIMEYLGDTIPKFPDNKKHKFLDDVLKHINELFQNAYDNFMRQTEERQKFRQSLEKVMKSLGTFLKALKLHENLPKSDRFLTIAQNPLKRQQCPQFAYGYLVLLLISDIMSLANFIHTNSSSSTYTHFLLSLANTVKLITPNIYDLPALWMDRVMETKYKTGNFDEESQRLFKRAYNVDSNLNATGLSNFMYYMEMDDDCRGVVRAPRVYNGVFRFHLLFPCVQQLCREGSPEDQRYVGVCLLRSLLESLPSLGTQVEFLTVRSREIHQMMKSVLEYVGGMDTETRRKEAFLTLKRCISHIEVHERKRVYLHLIKHVHHDRAVAIVIDELRQDVASTYTAFETGKIPMDQLASHPILSYATLYEVLEYCIGLTGDLQIMTICDLLISTLNLYRFLLLKESNSTCTVKLGFLEENKIKEFDEKVLKEFLRRLDAGYMSVRGELDKRGGDDASTDNEFTHAYKEELRAKSGKYQFLLSIMSRVTEILNENKK